jgi:hypothetical protein
MEAAPVRASAAQPCSVPPQGESDGTSTELILGRQVPTLARRSPDHISVSARLMNVLRRLRNGSRRLARHVLRSLPLGGCCKKALASLKGDL